MNNSNRNQKQNETENMTAAKNQHDLLGFSYFSYEQ